MSKKLGIAGLQLKKDFKNQSNNISNFIKTVKKVKSLYPWVNLIFTGELYLQSYGFPDWKNDAQEIPNENTNKISELAKSSKCWIIPGSILEKDGEQIFKGWIFQKKGLR